ncbi:DNA ligase D [Rhizorhapis suberifaciens]|uniref:DNA ligase (ATP) n=1 Tax=Rhizorhapis suberifaciens TaxID=13656 RepID=A0A840HSQ6_9SPHN|nr:DNA ligase D [Rhizorhapis suberifaciens]MBB4640544.1 bifunctional non-homologous end joining protein LigD [Rhizorhapis suberifaciens]
MATTADPLALYNAKRDFTKTAEPRGKRGAAKGNSFIVQKHDATRLHWDLRLEMNGVLKSWAVTRGPSLDPADKRLAVRTEDHPLGYATFEGIIPEKEYGGGTVMLWDRGTWEPVKGKKASDLEKGHLHFILHGERMKGEWLLIRLKGKPGEKRENWLLRKVEDEFAGSADLLTGRALTSVKTGRTMQEIAANVKAASPIKASTKGKRSAGKLPKFRAPQLATLVDHVPPGNHWLHELKYDGYRCLLAIGGGEARAYTRSGLDWSDKFLEIVTAAKGTDAGTALIDGEIIWMNAEGKPDFSGLQSSLKQGGRGLTFFAFDLLELDGEDLSKQPNILRKERLRGILPQDRNSPIQYAEHIVGEGEKLFRAMCDAQQEGIVSKRADAPYSGRRTMSWLKVKCTLRQEFVIVGWTPSSAKARPFSSLLLAQHESGGLIYKGRVGTGFDSAMLDDLREKMDKLARDKPALDVPAAARRGVRWIEPKLVAEVAFAEFTADGVVRHGSFLGLRSDKPAKEVSPEMPLPTSDLSSSPSSVKISNRDRVLFPGSDITKGELADYYAAVSALMLSGMANRPISLVRCPQGRAKKCFFQKHDAGSFGDHVHHVDIKEKGGQTEPYLCVSDADGIAACVQMGTIEFHGWGSVGTDVEKPDRMVFDLDPDEGLDFELVKKAARDLRRHLSDMGLVTFPMLTGGKGVHVIVPLAPDAEWPLVTDFSRRFAVALSEAEPERFTATMSKAKRKGRIFVDWLRNQRGSTAIMPYAVRARDLAPVAAPISWEELGEIDKASRFTIRDVSTLLERSRSRALTGWGIARQILPGH